MQIKTSYSKLVSLMNLMNLVTSKKGLSDDYKVVNLFVQDDKLYALSTDTSLYCLDTLDGEYDLEGEDNPFMVITIKEIMDALSKFSTLQRTEVKEVVLNTQQHGIVMSIVEEPKVQNDKTFNFADMYKGQTSRYKLNNQRVKAVITKELPTIIMPSDGIEMNSKDLQKYLDYMYPPMTKPKDPAVLNFKEEFVCSIMGNLYGISMPNTLPLDIFNELSLSLHTMNFLRNILSSNDTFKIYKEVQYQKIGQSMNDEDSNSTKLITLLIQSGNTLIKIKTNDVTDATNSSVFKSIGLNSIEVDKPYFLDSLKRLEGYDQVYIEIKITEDENIMGNSKGEMILKTMRTCQSVPIKCAHGNGEFKFMLKPENLGLMVFTHLTKDMDGNSDKINDLIFYMDGEPGNPVNLTCRDKSEDWQTRYPRAPFREAPQLDF